MNQTSQISIVLIVNVVSYVLTTWLGLTIDNQNLTAAVETAVIVGTAIWARVAHKKAMASAGAPSN